MSNKTAKIKQTKLGLIPKLRFPEFQNNSEWKIKKIGDKNFASLHKGKGISKSDIDLNGKIPCIRYGELYTQYNEVIDVVFSKTSSPTSDLFFSHKNDVILPASGETKIDIAKASCVTLENVALGGDLNVIRSKDNGIFISYYLNGPKKREIAKVAQGDSVVHLYLSQLEKLELLIPKEPEQQKIADCLSSVDDLIVAQGQKVDALKKYKKGLMRQLFPCDGETTPRLRFLEFQTAGKWEEKTLSDVSIVIMGSSPKSECYNQNQIGLPLLQGNADIKNRRSAPRVFTSEITKECLIGDILMSVRAPVGSIAKSYHHACIGRGIAAIRSKQPNSQEFVFQWLLSFEEKWINLSQGGTFDAINSDDLRKVCLLIPTPSEQQKIADFLSSLDDLIATQTQKLETLKAHKKGLMQQLFPTVSEVQE